MRPASTLRLTYCWRGARSSNLSNAATLLNPGATILQRAATGSLRTACTVGFESPVRWAQKPNGGVSVPLEREMHQKLLDLQARLQR